MSSSHSSIIRRLGAGAALLSIGLLVAACSEESPKEQAKEPAKTPTESAATTETQPAATTETKTAETPASAAKPAAEVKVPEAQGSVDVAALMAPGPLEDISIGKADAPVTIIEYMSMTCPHCANFHEKTFDAIKTKYVDTGRVRFILREFPLDLKATAAIMLARCAPKEQYFPLVAVLFKQQMTWAVAEDTRGALLQTAKLAGFTQESFNACLTNQKLLDDVTAVRTKADKEFGVQSTPTFFINGNRYAGGMSVEEMSAVIDAVK